jgi:Subunit ChlI of Mg-chelatase
VVQRVSTVAFEGIEARAVDVQVQVAPGLPAFAIVGLPDKAVSEAKERVRSALIASGLALPARRITINLALRRRRDRRRRAHQPAAVSQPPPFGLDAGAGRRRLALAARRNIAGA